MANLIDGKAIAAQIREEVKVEAEKFCSEGIIPKLAVVLVGDDPASVVYAKSKQKAASKVGIDFELFEMAGSTPEADVLALIEKLNNDKNVHGIMVELPLPKHISKENIMSAVHPKKDVDGVHPIN